MPISSILTSLIVFFFAAVIFLSEVYLGVLSLRSQEIIQGVSIWTFCKPVSISLIISKVLSLSFLILEAKLATGQLTSADRIWAVWLASSSIAYEVQHTGLDNSIYHFDTFETFSIQKSLNRFYIGNYFFHKGLAIRGNMVIRLKAEKM